MGTLITQSAAAAAMKGDRSMTSREDNRRLAEAYNEAMGIGDTNLPDELTDDPDDFSHNYAACQDPICPLCEAYGDGYTVGKEKAYFEVRSWHPKEHAPSCGCNPCMAARSVIEKIVDADSS